MKKPRVKPLPCKFRCDCSCFQRGMILVRSADGDFPLCRVCDLRSTQIHNNPKEKENPK